jgi:hypothetical protein
MLGHEVGAPADQNRSLQERATNPNRFAQFFRVLPSGQCNIWFQKQDWAWFEPEFSFGQAHIICWVF